MKLNKDIVLSEMTHKGYASIPLKNGLITIEPRPSYCDRGRFIVKIFPDMDQQELFIDGQDMFPRYYFNDDCMIKELELFIEKRKQEK